MDYLVYYNFVPDSPFASQFSEVTSGMETFRFFPQVFYMPWRRHILTATGLATAFCLLVAGIIVFLRPACAGSKILCIPIAIGNT